MTDADLMERADRALVTAQQQVTDLITTREQEAAKFEARKAQVVRVAHSLGTLHGIGGPLDDLLAEFDLPRRGSRHEARAQVVVFLPVTPGGSSIPLNGIGYMYPTEQTVISHASTWAGTLSTFEGEPACVCSRTQEAVMRWMRDAWNVDVVAKAHVQIGAVSCTGSDCTNGPVTAATEGVLPVVPIPFVDPDRTA